MVCEPIWKHLAHDSETHLRMRPLREQWEARGPGLLKYAGQQLPWLTWPSHPVIHLVAPQQGGGGRVVTESEIEFETMLFHPHPALPEIARLAWLLIARASLLKSCVRQFSISNLFLIALKSFAKLRV